MSKTLVLLLIFLTLSIAGGYYLHETYVTYVAAPVSQHAAVMQNSPSNHQVNVISSEQNKIRKLLESRKWWLIIPVFWFFGLLLALTPCLLPLLIIITSILGGGDEALSRKKAFSLSLVYVLSLAISYAVAGIVVASFGFYLQGYMQSSWVITVFAALFIILGISSLGFFNLQLPNQWRRVISNYTQKKGGSYIGVALMGIFATLIASPCVAAPLVGVLAYVTASGDVHLGGLTLFSMGLGIGSPPLLLNVVGSGLIQKAGKWQKYIKQFFGVVLLGISIWLLARIMPGQYSLFLWATLFIFTAVLMGVLKKQPDEAMIAATQNTQADTVVRLFSKMASLMILVYGCALLVGSILGNSNPLSPLEKQAMVCENPNTPKPTFKTVTTYAALQNILKTAKQANKPVMVMFSANWCGACQKLKTEVIMDPAVKLALKNVVLLDIEMGNATPDEMQIVKNYNVVGPPALLFFDKNGMISHERIDGLANADDLLKILRSLAS